MKKYVRMYSAVLFKIAKTIDNLAIFHQGNDWMKISRQVRISYKKIKMAGEINACIYAYIQEITVTLEVRNQAVALGIQQHLCLVCKQLASLSFLSPPVFICILLLIICLCFLVISSYWVFSMYVPIIQILPKNCSQGGLPTASFITTSF